MDIPRHDISLLYVEDDPAARTQISVLLQRAVTTLYVAANGREGLELFSAHSPDIILTDIMMPVMNGLDMAREVRKLNPDCQIIVLTAFSDTEYMLDCISIGINQYILKPVDLSKLMQAVGACSDYIQLKRRLKKQDDYIHLLSEAMEQAPTLVMITDLNGTIEYVNTMFTRVTGYTPAEVIGKTPSILKSDLTLPWTYQELWQNISMGNEWESELANRKKNGEIYWELVKICPVRDASGTVYKYLKVAQDITERKHYEESLRFLSTHDSLTGLYNRAFFEAEVKRLAASRDFPVSIIIADIDGLKLVNDTWGHSRGDNVIRAAAESILTAYRAGDVVSRIGGDEFAVLLPRTDEQAALNAVQRIKNGCNSQAVEQPGCFQGLSLGVATARSSAELEHALKSADARMYEDKKDKKKSAQSTHHTGTTHLETSSDPAVSDAAAAEEPWPAK